MPHSTTLSTAIGQATKLISRVALEVAPIFNGEPLAEGGLWVGIGAPTPEALNVLKACVGVEAYLNVNCEKEHFCQWGVERVSEGGQRV
jgi:hypothetical protein